MEKYSLILVSELIDKVKLKFEEVLLGVEFRLVKKVTKRDVYEEALLGHELGETFKITQIGKKYSQYGGYSRDFSSDYECVLLWDNGKKDTEVSITEVRFMLQGKFVVALLQGIDATSKIEKELVIGPIDFSDEEEGVDQELSKKVIEVINNAERVSISGIKVKFTDAEGNSPKTAKEDIEGVTLVRGEITTSWSDKPEFWVLGTETDGVGFGEMTFRIDGKKMVGSVPRPDKMNSSYAERVKFKLARKDVVLSIEARKRVKKFIQENDPEFLIEKDENNWKKLLWKGWGGRDFFIKWVKKIYDNPETEKYYVGIMAPWNKDEEDEVPEEVTHETYPRIWQRFF